jgi:cell division septation protein DedD
MTNGEPRNRGDLVLESRHLVGLFLLLVVVFGVVFTLGYMLGRSQYDTKLRAAVGAPTDADAPADPAVSNSTGSMPGGENLPPQKKSDWDFYHSGEPKKSEDHLQPPPAPAPYAKSVMASKPTPEVKPSTAPAKPAKPGKSSAAVGAPLIPNGAVMLQVAAVERQGDALALAQALQGKKFPAFVVPPKTDKYYRVQVGPYANTQAVTSARHDLEANGFKPIVKH